MGMAGGNMDCGINTSIYITYMAVTTCRNEKRKSFDFSTLVRLSYNGHVLADTTKIENGIMPPPPRRAMGPDRNCRQLNCPVPIAHRGGGSAEVALEAAFSYKKKEHPFFQKIDEKMGVYYPSYVFELQCSGMTLN